MTKDDLFPTPINTDTDYEHEPEPEFEQTPFSSFEFPDSFGYTFIAALKEQRDQLDTKISGVLAAIQREAIERARAFIHEYNLTKADIYPKSSQANKGPPCPACLRHRAKQSGHHHDGRHVIKSSTHPRIFFAPGHKNRPNRQTTEFDCRCDHYVSAT